MVFSSTFAGDLRAICSGFYSFANRARMAAKVEGGPSQKGYLWQTEPLDVPRNLLISSLLGGGGSKSLHLSRLRPDWRHVRIFAAKDFLPGESFGIKRHRRGWWRGFRRVLLSAGHEKSKKQKRPNGARSACFAPFCFYIGESTARRPAGSSNPSEAESIFSESAHFRMPTLPPRIFARDSGNLREWLAARLLAADRPPSPLCEMCC